MYAQQIAQIERQVEAAEALNRAAHAMTEFTTIMLKGPVTGMLVAAFAIWAVRLYFRVLR